MSKIKRNPKAPYNAKSNYGKMFAKWKSAQVITFSKMVEIGKSLGMNETAAKASATVLISPRKSDEECRGDCRGNYSAMGEYYYAEVLKQKSGEEKRFRLRYRSEILEPRNRPVKQEIAPVKTKTKASAKTEVKAEAETAKIAKTVEA